MFLGLSGRRRADAGHGQEDGRPADHPRDGESGAGDPARAREGGAPRLPHRHRPLRLSEPGQQLAVLPVHLPRRARLRRDDDQRGDEARGDARARGARAGGALRDRRARVRRGDAAVRSRLPHPARVRSAAHHEHGARRREGGDGQRRRDAADRGLRRVSRASSTGSSTSPARRWSRCSPRRSRRPSASSTPKARTSACCARRRSSVDEGLAQPDAGRPHRRHREPHPEARAAARRSARTATASTSWTTRAIATTGREYYQLAQRKGVSRAQAQEDMRSRPTLVGAMLVHRGDADAMLCGTSRQLRRPPALHPQRDRHARGREDAGGDADADPARTGSSSSATRTSIAIPTAEQIAEMTLLAAEEVQRFGAEAVASRSLSHSSFGSSDAPSAQKMRDALAADPRARAGPRRSKARCAPTPRCRRRIRDQEFPDSRLTEDANLLDHAERRRGEHHVQRAARHRRRRHHGGRHPARRGEGRCTS